MKLFRGKPDRRGGAKAGSAAPDGNGGARATHLLTLDLARAEKLAGMLAHSRAAKSVEVADLLAGMYMYEWERLARFWDHRERVERLLQQMCNISPQRWHHWIEFYDTQRRKDEKEAATFPGFAKRQEEEAPLGQSTELQELFRAAEELSPFLDRMDADNVPVLTTECMLLCIARNERSELSRRLRETGLDLEALELAARDPRRAPPR